MICSKIPRIGSILLGIGCFGVFHLAWAQEDTQNPETPSALPPIANFDDIEPAVDVGEMTAVTRAPASSRARAMDTLNLGTTSVTGSQELPKVLYIVPWKQSDLGDLVGRPVNTLLDEVLAPIDPEEFERHLEYYDVLYGDAEKE
jgi:hypothetical protein